MLPNECPRLAVLLAALALTLACQQPSEKRFAFSTDAPSRAGLEPVVDGVVVGNEAGRLLRLGRSGEPVWRMELGHEVAVRPTVAGDSVVAGTVGGVLVCLRLSNGEERWRLTGQPPVLTPLVSDTERVYVVAPDGAVRAHAMAHGEERWRRPLPPGSPPPEAAKPLPSPVLSGNLLVVALGEAGLVALGRESGAVQWQQPLPQVLGLEVQGDVLYVTTRRGQVLALGLVDGKQRWQRMPAPALTSPPTLALGRLWVGASEPEQLLGLAPGTGEVVTRVSLPQPLVAQVAEHRELLLVPTRSRQGWLLALKNGEGPPTFTLRMDTPLITRPVVLGDQLFVLGLDGRVLSWRLQTPDS